MTRVLIVDDHALVRSGLRLLLESEEDITVDDEGGNADEAVRLARLHKPDVVLLDVVMPGRSGLEAVPEILQAAPKARILVLSMQDDPSYVREAFSAGASGYLLKEAADNELVAAVREVAAGRRYVHPTLGARLAAAEAEAEARAAADPRVGARARGAATARPRPHEPGDREDALHLGQDGRDAPGAHHAEAAAHHPRGARALCPPAGAAGGGEEKP